MNVLTEIVLISRSLFYIVEPEVSFDIKKHSYTFIKLFYTQIDSVQEQIFTQARHLLD